MEGNAEDLMGIQVCITYNDRRAEALLINEEYAAKWVAEMLPRMMLRYGIHSGDEITVTVYNQNEGH
jgi:hypothetical protein